MKWNDIGALLATAAPSIAAAIGGPLASGAVTALEAAFGINTVGTMEDKKSAIIAAITGATPEQLLAVKKADQEYAIKMAELGFKNVADLEALAASDRDSARKREIEVKDNTPKILAYTLTLGFFMVLGFMLFASVPDGSRDLLNILLGMLATSFSGVIAYYFGSSNGSSEKTRLLAMAGPVKI